MTEENKRLKSKELSKDWKKWGPYLSERQWGTVREDYSVYGDAWDYLPHDHSRSRTYRWGEDGIGGFSDNKQRICLSFAFWNENDSILKERFYGLTGKEGNHGEDVKEIYYYLDSTPTHSYMKMLYKYPILAFPYEDIIEKNKGLSRNDAEYELVDTKIFDNNNYFDIEIEYAKASQEDIVFKVIATNRSANKAKLHVLPTITFRNSWSYLPTALQVQKKPKAKAISNNSVKMAHPDLGDYFIHFQEPKDILFCDNETNKLRIFGTENDSKYCKDGINKYLIDKETAAINPSKEGTKFAAQFELSLEANESKTIYLRLNSTEEFNQDFESVFSQRKQEADDFYAEIQQDVASNELKSIQRQAFAGMLWNKQYYKYDLETWLSGDPNMPFDFNGRNFNRNESWKDSYMSDILSMPDKWEYPWFAAWDLAFHTLTLARVDSEFAKNQLEVVLKDRYQHPNGQIPAYEWNFSDVNPPVHAWATWKVYELEKNNNNGEGDLFFLEKVFHKLLLNFTWWVNQKDENGNNIFGGGFLGLDNIGVFDRNANIPGFELQQADATGWMAIYTLNMLRIACEISLKNPVYQDLASKFFDHFLMISEAINSTTEGENEGLWDEEDEFFYDKVNNPFGQTVFLKVRSLVGLIPLCAVEVLDDELLNKLPIFKERIEWYKVNKPELANLISKWDVPGVKQTHLFSLLRSTRMRKVFERLFDESEFLSDYGIRSLSKFHKDHPFTFDLHGEKLTIAYSPAESELTIMGGNSNWRGPIWFPLNYLIIDSLYKFATYYGDEYEVEYPTKSGKMITIKQAAALISERLIKLFQFDSAGEVPSLSQRKIFCTDPNFKNYSLFYEYFNGDNGNGLGAAHQTGWTGLVADLIAETSKLKKN